MTNRTVSLQELYVSQCAVHNIKPDAIVSRILDNEYAGSVLSLDFSSNYLGTPAIRVLFEVLNGCANLQSLNLSSIYLKNDAMPALVTLAESLPELQRLDLSGNTTLGFAAGVQIIKLLKAIPHIIDVNVKDTGIAAGTLETIQQLAATNAEGMAEAEQQRLRLLQQRQLQNKLSPLRAASLAKAARVQEHGQYVLGVEGTLDRAVDPIPHPLPEVDGAPMYNDVIRTENLKLKSPLLEHEERTLAMYEHHLQKCPVKKDKLLVRANTSNELLDQFDKGSKWAYISTFDVPQLIAAAGSEISEEEIQQWLDWYRPQDEYTDVDRIIRPQLQELLDPLTSRRRCNEVMETLQRVIAQQSPGIEELVDFIPPLFELLHDTTSPTDSLLQQLAATAERVPVLLGKAEQAERAGQLAVREEDLERAETWHDASLKHLQDLLEIVLERIHALQSFRPPEDSTAPENTPPGLEARARQLFSKLRQRISDFMARIMHDQDRLLAARQREKQKFDESAFQHLQSQKRGREALSNAVMKQNDIWQQVERLHEQLLQLARERHEEVVSWMQETERQQRVELEYQQFNYIADQYKDKLSRIAEQALHFTDLFDPLEKFFAQCTAMAKVRVEKADVNVDQILLDEQRQHYEIFRRYYLSLGDLLLKKEKRLEEIERNSRFLDSQIGLCLDTFDPNLSKYRESKKELEVVAQQIRNKVTVLRENGQRASEDFKPSEFALKVANEPVLSPVIELQELNVSRRERLQQLRKSALGKDKEALEFEEAELESLAVTTKQAKMTGIASLLRPLSPNAPPKFRKIESYSVSG